jgi:hypothetical protein
MLQCFSSQHKLARTQQRIFHSPQIRPGQRLVLFASQKLIQVYCQPDNTSQRPTCILYRPFFVGVLVFAVDQLVPTK